MRRCTEECEGAIGRKEAQNLVDGTSQIARLANRVLMVAKQEAENSEDPVFIGRVTEAADTLQASTIYLSDGIFKIYMFSSENLTSRCHSNGARCQIRRLQYGQPRID